MELTDRGWQGAWTLADPILAVWLRAAQQEEGFRSCRPEYRRMFFFFNWRIIPSKAPQNGTL